ncbi:MAG: GNAT family N-acetyltransferase [Anaerolineae bacterium]|nr:GNAT family N-acetyltransferase [Anaerolineae bacterium]
MVVAELLSVQQSNKASGLRPVRLRQDLGDIAELIDLCFASTLDAAGHAAIREMRTLSRSGPLLWALNNLTRALTGWMQGFVWVEHGRLVGNVSVSPTGFDRGWVIANVAVHPDYRRRGIARQMTRAALDLVARQGTFATLQVDADNDTARRLYASFGFEELRTFSRWRRMPVHRLPPSSEPLPIRRLSRADSAAAYMLARRVRPDERGGMGWLRPTSERAFNSYPLGGFHALWTGRTITRWGIAGRQRPLDALLITESRAGRLTMRFDMLVRPERAGEFEYALIDYLIRRLAGQQRALVTDHPADDEYTMEVFRRHHFQRERMLVHMLWRVPASPGAQPIIPPAPSYQASSKGER